MENDSEAVHEPLFQVEYMMDRLGQVYNDVLVRAVFSCAEGAHDSCFALLSIEQGDGCDYRILALETWGKEKASLLGFFDSWDFVLHFCIVGMILILNKGAVMLFNVFIWRAKSQRGPINRPLRMAGLIRQSA